MDLNKAHDVGTNVFIQLQEKSKSRKQNSTKLATFVAEQAPEQQNNSVQMFGMMENGQSSLKESVCSEVMDSFSLEVAHLIASKNVVKEIEDLSHQICKYHMLAMSLGTGADNTSLRLELRERQEKACEKIHFSMMQLSDAFRRVELIPKQEIGDLERSCKILVACIHTLDRVMRRTMHLYHLFPLVPHPDGRKETLLIRTGCSIPSQALPVEEAYLKERERCTQLEKKILMVHDLDVELHRDHVLGPVLDYLTLCPMGDLPGSTLSLDDVSDLPDGYCDGETLFRKKSNLFCYISAVVGVACIGGGVLMGVIFMMVQ